MKMTKLNIEKLYLSRAKLVMKVLGLWMMSEQSLVYKIHGVFMIFLQYLFLIFQIVYIAQAWGDLDAVSQASYLLFTQACLCFKVTVFLINTGALKDLLQKLNGDIFKPQSALHEKILRRQASRIKRLLLGFMLSSQTTCALWALKPLLDDTGRSFPFDMWMPVAATHSPQYQLGYAFQFLTISMSAYLYFAVDSIALSLVIFGCAQLQIVEDKILSIKAPKGKNAAIRKEMSEKNYRKLIECSAQHQEIVSLSQLVENAYHTYLCFQLSGSVGLICMSALRILVVEWMSMQFVSIVVYLTVMISQLYVCCWCGHELTATSAHLHSVLYSCAWYEQDLRFMRALCVFMTRAARPIVLRAGRYVVLSRQTFVTILRMSYSYFAVLNRTKTSS